MKFFAITALCVIVAARGFAAESFPGLKSILSEAEWKRAGLDRLSPDEIGVIDAGMIRYQGQTRQQHDADLAAARAAAPVAAPVADNNPAGTPKPGFWERFGLFESDRMDWRDVPPLEAKVVKWVSANRFELDNGQQWEGMEAITYQLSGKVISIHARPHGMYALSVDGQNTTLRVRRVR